MIFKLHPDARTEYREANMFTGQAAEKFSNAVENAIAKIVRRPEWFRCDGPIQILTSFAAVRSPPSSPVLRTPRGSMSNSLTSLAA